MASSGMSFVMTEPAANKALSPIVTGAMMVELEPTKALSPTVVLNLFYRRS